MAAKESCPCCTLVGCSSSMSDHVKVANYEWQLDNASHIYLCWPTRDEYILSCGLHMCLCPQQRCNPLCEEYAAHSFANLGCAPFASDLPWVERFTPLACLYCPCAFTKAFSHHHLGFRPIRCCCWEMEDKYIYCCLPSNFLHFKYKYILSCGLHMCLCPQQRCDPQCDDRANKYAAHSFANFGCAPFDQKSSWVARYTPLACLACPCAFQVNESDGTTSPICCYWGNPICSWGFSAPRQGSFGW
jgi:hypothetical protein